MDNSVHKKANLILAGLAIMPSLATASNSVREAQPNAYCSPYSENQKVPNNLDETTGLSVQELQEGKDLVRVLNQLDVVAVSRLNLTEAPRLAALRKMIAAAK